MRPILEDVVNAQWLNRHNITLPHPRKPGYYESDSAGVVINGHGFVVSAEEKDRSIFGILMNSDQLDDGATRTRDTYLDWRAAFMNGLEGRNFKYDSERLGAPTDMAKIDRFVKLLKYLQERGRYQTLVLVDLALLPYHPFDPEAKDADSELAAYCDAFDRLGRAIQYVVKLTENS